MSQPILFDEQDGIAVLTVNRPEVRNGLNWAAQALFAEHVARMAESRPEGSRLRVLIIIGAGQHSFVSGGDLRELAKHPEKEAGARLRQLMTATLEQLTTLPVPVIAAINGDAVGGGCEIVTACDLRLATRSATLRFAQVSVGLTTGWGGAARLVRLIGLGRAQDLLLTGRRLSAQEAWEWGLVQRVVDEPALPAALALAEDLAAMPRQAMAAMKALVQGAVTLPPAAAADLESRLFLSLWGEADHQEALRAFLEKRQPLFRE